MARFRTTGNLEGWLRPHVVIGVALLTLAGSSAFGATNVSRKTVGTSPKTLATGDSPDFDAVSYQPLICDSGGDPAGDESPGAVDIVGDATHAPTYVAWDATYAYFRFRVNSEPSGPTGFAQSAWVILLQVPSGNPFQYQFELSLDGKGGPDDFGNTGDSVELWKNDPATDISFSPNFNDPSELRLYSQRYDFAGPTTVNTTPLARISLANDGSSFGGDADYFVDFAIPISVLVAKGVIASVSDVSECLFFPATSTDSNQYNKDHLACKFLPYTTLSITKGVAPSVLPANTSTSVVHTITVQNVGTLSAKGLTIDDPAFPSFLSGITVAVSSDDPGVTWTIVTTSPLHVTIPRLPVGKSVTVTISSSGSASCGTAPFTNTATAAAVNAPAVSAQATLSVGSGGAEICDGKDNNCNGQVDEGASICDDGNACNGHESCVQGACKPGTALQCDDANPCTVDTCVTTAGCVHENAPNGTSCNDGNACTQADVCVAGSCTGTDPVVCSALDQCHDAGSCNPSTGGCSNPAKPNGTSCNDGNACTQIDTCQSGGCVGSNPVTCSASDQCHVAGTCDPATGTCSNPAKSDGSACNDGNACTQSDTCQSGACTGVNPMVCTASDQCHDAGICDPATGACSNPAKPDGSSCNDGNACTQSDTCQSGACTGADPVVCTASDQCHIAGTCNPATGACSNPAKPNGTACDDGNPCTQTDTCQSGSCAGSNGIVCTAQDQCHVAGICDPATGTCSNPDKSDGSACNDGNKCTQSDTCQSGTCTGADPVVCTASDQCHDAGTCDTATGACSNPARPNGATCSDGNACTQSDTCLGGACTGADPVLCSASDQCHDAGTCNPATGACSNPPKANGMACDDGNPCTRTDTCQAGSCVGSNGTVCTPLDQCHVAGTCDPATGTCSNPAKADGSACNDKDACTQTDTCQSGGCTGSSPVVCTASDQCHDAGTCNPAIGVCSNPAKPNGSSCNDGNACTQSDTCQGGACTGSDPVSCFASDPCHNAGTCNPSTGVCSNPSKPNGTSCDDGNPCTRTDACQSGACVGSNGVVCTPLDQCHVAGTCDQATGTCSNPAKPDGTVCNDGNACTQTDTCQSGGCTGSSPFACTASDQCHLPGTCNASTGACSNPAKPNGSSCNDGNACTQTDTCQSGTCAGSSPVSCTASDQCHLAGTCNPSTGVCSNPSKPDGTSCNDANACTQSDTCQSGACTGGNALTCTASDQCHSAGACNPSTGVCSNPAKPNGTACTDGNACTTNDVCTSGACVSGASANCDDHNGCTDDDCNPATGCTHSNNTNPCEDGSVCTTPDTCGGGVCVAGPPSTPQCQEARTIGYFKRLCDGPFPGDGLTQANADCVNDWSTFSSVTSVADICRVMHFDDSNDKCLQAESQFMAALLNYCRGGLLLGQSIHSSCTSNVSVGQSFTDANKLLSSSGRTDADCVRAQCESEELNTSKAIESNSLRVDRVAGIVHVSWTAPPWGEAGAPSSYTLWRRTRGVGPFAVLATIPGFSYDDKQATPGTDFEYQVTSNR